MEALVTRTAKRYEILESLLAVVRIRAVVYVQRGLVTTTQAASVLVSTMDLHLEYHPLFGSPTFRVGPLAKLGEESLLPQFVEATLIFSVIIPLFGATLAEQLCKSMVPDPTRAEIFQAAMHL